MYEIIALISGIIFVILGIVLLVITSDYAAIGVILGGLTIIIITIPFIFKFKIK